MIMHSSKQAGVSLSGFLVWCVIFAVGALIGFKLAPAYMEDATIKKHLRTIAKDGNYASGNRKDIEGAFSSRAQIDRIEVIGPQDIQIEKSGGGIVLSAQYTTRIPLVYNISACMDFKPSSR